MNSEGSPYAAEWRMIAARDLERMRVHLGLDDAVAAGFFLQQAVEKFLKAYLLERGWELRRTHDLGTLLEEAVKHDPGLEHFRASCERITDLYLAQRYPGTQTVAAASKSGIVALLPEVTELISILNQAAAG